MAIPTIFSLLILVISFSEDQANCAELSKAPKIVDAVETINHPEDTNATLYCSIGSGDLDGLTYEWFKDEKRLGPTSNSKKLRFSIPSENFQSVLRIIDLKPEDAGVYSCVARNAYGHDKISIRLNVKVQLKWIKEPKDEVELGVGKYLHIPCVAEGMPQPVIEWKKVVEGKSEVIGPELRVNSVTPEDGGTYECRARNGVERDLIARIQINVLGE